MANHKSKIEYDYLVIGAGPAGLQLGYYLEEANRNYLILERGDSAGTFFKKFPRHRTLISNNKVYTGYDNLEINERWDWNSLLSDDPEMLFKHYSKRYFPPADQYVRYLADFADRFSLNIRYNTEVERVSKDGIFQVTDTDGNVFTSEVLVVATGYGKPYIPPIPGIELAEDYSYVSVDPEEFVNQKVLIIGKGNSGFETAENLIETAAVIHVGSPSPLNLAWKTHFVGHLRAVNNNFLDTYQLKSQNAVLDATFEKIEKRDGKYFVSVSYTHANGEKEELCYDRVITCTGFRFDDSIFDDNCKPALVINDRFPEQTSSWESTNVTNLFFAGSLTHMRDYKKTTSGFIHGFRYNVRTLFHFLEERYQGVPYPSYEATASPEALTSEVIARVNGSASLWQQFSFMCDLIVIQNGEETARIYRDLPIDYVHDTSLGRAGHYYVVTLEFGKVKGDPFNIQRDPNPDVADRSVFLHPVVRRYRGSELIDEIHLLEDLDAVWDKPELHVQPLFHFMQRNMAPVVMEMETA